jgi:hypothetical protein
MKRGRRARVSLFVCTGNEAVPDCPYTGRNKLMTEILPAEYVHIHQHVKQRLDDVPDITLALDGWTSPRMESIYSFIIILPDSSRHVWATKENSAERNTGIYIAGIGKHLRGWVFLALQLLNCGMLCDCLLFVMRLCFLHCGVLCNCLLFVVRIICSDVSGLILTR